MDRMKLEEAIRTFVALTLSDGEYIGRWSETIGRTQGFEAVHNLRVICIDTRVSEIRAAVLLDSLPLKDRSDG